MFDSYRYANQLLIHTAEGMYDSELILGGVCVVKGTGNFGDERTSESESMYELTALEKHSERKTRLVLLKTRIS